LLKYDAFLSLKFNANIQHSSKLIINKIALQEPLFLCKQTYLFYFCCKIWQLFLFK